MPRRLRIFLIVLIGEPPASGVVGLAFTVEQLELMLAEARRREKGVA